MYVKSFEGLVKTIESLTPQNGQKIIAIDGGGGAGKSTLAERLQKALPNSAVIHIDDFYKGPWDKRLDHTNYDVHPFFDWKRFESEVIKPLKENREIVYHVYDWHKHIAEEVVSVPKNAVIILEGGAVLQKDFADVYDLKIWLEADEAERLKRALARDGEHMRFLWEEDWLPVERNYIRIQNPAARSDIIIKNDFNT